MRLLRGIKNYSKLVHVKTEEIREELHVFSVITN